VPTPAYFINSLFLAFKRYTKGSLTQREGYKYGWPPCNIQFRSAPFYIENIIYHFYKTSSLNEEVNCTEPFHSVSIPWFYNISRGWQCQSTNGVPNFFLKKKLKKKFNFFVSFTKLKKTAKPSRTYWDSLARILARSGSDNNYKTQQLKYLNLQKKNVLKH
jgi:hypothetical protein